jgi:SAM-dependent methyltransferase
MRLSRDTALKIHALLDQWLPPILRDQRWLMKPLIKHVFKQHTAIVLDFKKRAWCMSDGEYTEAYRLTSQVGMERPTDLNQACISKIQSSVFGTTVLEVGCGRGHLVNLLRSDYNVTASDIVIPANLKNLYPDVAFHEADIENLPFADASFDTVICTHTLEHVRHLQKAISELRRVSRKRLIIVVPKQRPYLYTFDLHIHFFPYLHSFLQVMGTEGLNLVCTDEGGDIYYQEDRS